MDKVEETPTSATGNRIGMEVRDREEARICFERAIQEKPDDSYSMHQLGLLYEEEYRDENKAREYFRKAVETNSSNFAAWSSLGASQMKTAPLEALQCFDTALAINNMYARAHKNRGLVLLRQDGRVKEGIESLNKALKVDPMNASVLNVLGEVYEGKLGDPVQAEKYFRAAMMADRWNPTCHVHMATLYDKKGNYEAAKRSFEAALAIDPMDVSAMSKFAKLLEAHFPAETPLIRYLLTFAMEVASSKDEAQRFRALLRRFNSRCNIDKDEQKSAAELHGLLGMVPAWLDASASSGSAFDAQAAEETALECPRRHKLWRIFKKPRVYRPRCTWACEECKRSIGGADLSVNGALFCGTCKYDLCHQCSMSARVAHLLPDPPKIIGRGGFGTVWREFSRDLGMYCAVKRTSILSSDVEKEVRLMLHFQQHPNVVKLYSYERCNDSPTASGGLVIWMELMAGSVLSKVVEKGALHEKEARSVVRDALRGLCALHALRPRPVIHRDIKPDNLLVACDGTVKLSDFGLSKHASAAVAGSTVQLTDVRGTPQYLAPECFSDPKPIWTTAADIWALGCTWISICTGKPPYDGTANISRLEQMWGFFSESASSGPIIPPFLSSRAQVLIRKCLARDFKARPSANVLLDDEYFTVDDSEFEKFVPDIETDEGFALRVSARQSMQQVDSGNNSCRHWQDDSGAFDTLETEEYLGNTVSQISCPQQPQQQQQDQQPSAVQTRQGGDEVGGRLVPDQELSQHAEVTSNRIAASQEEGEESAEATGGDKTSSVNSGGQTSAAQNEGSIVGSFALAIVLGYVLARLRL